VKDSGDLLLSGARPVPSLAPGGSSTGSKAVTVPTSVPSGTYRLLPCADDLKKITELGETNNCLAAATAILIRP
jgi:hypothetical protein